MGGNIATGAGTKELAPHKYHTCTPKFTCELNAKNRVPQQTYCKGKKPQLCTGITVVPWSCEAVFVQVHKMVTPPYNRTMSSFITVLYCLTFIHYSFPSHFGWVYSSDVR